MNLIKRLLERNDAKQTIQFTAALAPDRPFFAVGDLHGALDPFRTLLQEIEKHEERPTVVCVGDFVDRGEHSASVLRLLKRLNQEFPDLFFCLKGNHEDMLLAFLDMPEKEGPRWLRHGGLQTLASFHVSYTQGGNMIELRDRLADAMGAELVHWIRDLPVYWQSGNVYVVHAGADPARPIDEQRDSALLWGHSDFFNTPRADGNWVVHGHNIVKEANSKNGRIAIDTGAYATGILTAAYIQPNQVSFLRNKG